MNERKKPIIVRNNYMMLVALIFLCAFGAIMVFSASAYMCSISKEYEYDSFFLLKRQGMFMIAGLAVMLVVQRFSYRLLKGFLAILLYLSGVASIFLLLTPLGVNANGATRWVKIEPFGRFQVSEWVKICVIIFMAYLIDRYKRSLGRLKLTVYLWIL